MKTTLLIGFVLSGVVGCSNPCEDLITDEQQNFAVSLLVGQLLRGADVGLLRQTIRGNPIVQDSLECGNYLIDLAIEEEKEFECFQVMEGDIFTDPNEIICVSVSEGN